MQKLLLSRTASKIKYILVVIDILTKFVETFSIPDLQAHTSMEVKEKSFAVTDSPGTLWHFSVWRYMIYLPWNVSDVCNNKQHLSALHMVGIKQKSLIIL